MMKHLLTKSAIIFLITSQASFAQSEPEIRKITGVNKINPTTVEILFSDRNRMTFDFYGENIFRLFQDPSGKIIRDPEAEPNAEILVENPRKPLDDLLLKTDGDTISISTNRIDVLLDKNTCRLKVRDKQSARTILEETRPALFEKEKVSLALKEYPDEYFYGGGVQNGRFSHKGKAIAIENQNSWTDGGVASPNPFYWSTNGYGLMWHTFKTGTDDFGAEEKGLVRICHETD
jgi:hypothetical protein